MKTFKVTINHDIYHTYMVEAGSPEEAKEKADEGDFERIDDIYCESSHVESVEETDEKICEDVGELSRYQICDMAYSLVSEVMLNCEINGERYAKLKQVRNHLINELDNS